MRTSQLRGNGDARNSIPRTIHGQHMNVHDLTMRWRACRALSQRPRDQSSCPDAAPASHATRMWMRVRIHRWAYVNSLPGGHAQRRAVAGIAHDSKAAQHIRSEGGRCATEHSPAAAQGGHDAFRWLLHDPPCGSLGVLWLRVRAARLFVPKKPDDAVRATVLHHS
jgi:hypothetical protein